MPMPPIAKLLGFLKALPPENLSKASGPIMQNSSDSDTATGIFKIVLAWLAYYLGSITLQDIGVFLAITFTFLQIIVLLRDKFGFFTPKGGSK